MQASVRAPSMLCVLSDRDRDARRAAITEPTLPKARPPGPPATRVPDAPAHVCVCACVCVSVCVCACMCVYVCMYVCVCM